MFCAATFDLCHFQYTKPLVRATFPRNSPCSMLLLLAGSWGSCLPLRPVEGVPVGEGLPWGCPLEEGGEKTHQSSLRLGRQVIRVHKTQRSKRSIKGSEVTLWKTGGSRAEEKTRHVCTNVSLLLTLQRYWAPHVCRLDTWQMPPVQTVRGHWRGADRKWAHKRGRSDADSSMHLSSRRELGHNPTGPLWPKGLRGPPRPLLPLRIEVGWIRLPSANKKKYSFKLDHRTKFIRVLGFCGQFLFRTQT